MDIKNYLKERLEGGLFADISSNVIGDEYHLQIRLHTCLNGVVYELKNNNKYKTGDDLLSLEVHCIKIGEYDPDAEYEYVHGSFSYKKMIELLNNSAI